MDDKTEQIFEDLAQQMIEKAEQLNIGLEDFYRGLMQVRDSVQTRIDTAPDDGIDVDSL